MNTTPSKTNSGFPLAEYLNQLLFNPTGKTILNPFKFWHLQRIEQLEHCWEHDWTKLLEHCWTLKYQPEEHLVRLNKNVRGTQSEIRSERDGHKSIS